MPCGGLYSHRAFEGAVEHFQRHRPAWRASTCRGWDQQNNFFSVAKDVWASAIMHLWPGKQCILGQWFINFSPSVMERSCEACWLLVGVLKRLVSYFVRRLDLESLFIWAHGLYLEALLPWAVFMKQFLHVRMHCPLCAMLQAFSYWLWVLSSKQNDMFSCGGPLCWLRWFSDAYHR